MLFSRRTHSAKARYLLLSYCFTGFFLERFFNFEQIFLFFFDKQCPAACAFRVVSTTTEIQT
eukprot:UN26698